MSSRLALAMAMALLTACSIRGADGAGRAHLTIFAAASLTAALDKVQSAYEAANPGTTLTISTDASSSLATKIQQGAPADVFLSADAAIPQRLIGEGLATGTVVEFARNELTIIVPRANRAGIRAPADLARPGIKIIAAGDAVPITRYASQLVSRLARLPGYPADFVARYAANIASREDNVAAVVAKIALGEGDAGIVYATDAGTSTGIAEIAVTDAANVSAIYGGVVLSASSNPAAAAAFLRWLAGADGEAVLASFGFQPVK